MPTFAAGAYATFGTLVGVLLMSVGFCFIVSKLIKLEGGHGVRYCASGGFLGMIFQAFILLTPDAEFIFLRMLLFCCVVFAFMLFWRGLEIFLLEKNFVGKRFVAGGLIVAYALVLLLHPEPRFQLQFAAIVPVVVLPFAAKSMLACWPGRYYLAKLLIVTAVAILFAANLARFSGLQNTEEFIALSHALGIARPNILMAMFSFVGALVISGGIILLFFQRVLDQTNHAASHDELTGLRNRRAIITAGEREIEMAQRTSSAVTIAFVDVDFFKKINDQYGHDKGDLVLVEIAGILNKLCRASDLVGRYGGEEFCIIFPGEDVAGANGIGARLVRTVREHRFEGVPQVTISVGMAVMRADELPLSWHALVKLADIQLYKAKHSGRDRFCIDDERPGSAKAPGQQSLRWRAPPAAEAT